MICAVTIVITILQFADYWLTMKVLERGGIEFKSVMAKLIQNKVPKHEIISLQSNL